VVEELFRFNLKISRESFSRGKLEAKMLIVSLSVELWQKNKER
jgi:hypothetical protein